LKATKRHSAEQAIVAKDDIVPEGRGPNINYTLLAEAMRPIRRLLSYDAYPHFKVIHEGRSDHGKGATQLARCTAMILELSLVGFLSPLARKFDIYP
jgi:hypothetical protein